MPFTLSHPAAVLVAARYPLAISALVTGSVAPDVPEFIGIQADHPVWWEPYLSLSHTHSFTGIGVDLMYALLLLPLYMLVKRPVLAMMPSIAARVPKAPGYGRGAVGAARRTLWTLLSAAIGIVTHLVWDSFTHYDMFVDEHFSFVRTPVIAGFDVLRLLQYVSSVVGLVAIGFRLRRKWSSAVSHRLAPGMVLGNRARKAVISALVVACGIGVVQRVLDVNSFASIEVALRRIVVGGGFGIALGLVIYSFVWQAAHIGAPRHQMPEESGSAGRQSLALFDRNQNSGRPVQTRSATRGVPPVGRESSARPSFRGGAPAPCREGRLTAWTPRRRPRPWCRS